jgi:hypothetical protein
MVARIARAESCRIADVRGLIGTAHLDPRALAPSPQASIARAACEHRWPLAGKEGRVQFSFSGSVLGTWVDRHLARRSGATGMTIKVTRRAALIGLSTCVAAPVRAQTTSRPKDAADSVTLEQPAVFDIAANTGSLKETVQKGQQLVWRPKGGPSDGAFRVSNISIAFLRSESGGQVKMTFSGNVSSLGYLTSEEAKLNVIVRAKGGASLHSWSFSISVKCADKDQPLTPLTHDVPTDVAANVFTNVSAVEVAEPAEPNFPGVKIQKCN